MSVMETTPADDKVPPMQFAHWLCILVTWLTFITPTAWTSGGAAAPASSQHEKIAVQPIAAPAWESASGIFHFSCGFASDFSTHKTRIASGFCARGLRIRIGSKDPTGLDWEWTQDNSVELNKGHWEYIPGTDITVPQPLPTFTPQNNGGSSQFTWGDAGNLVGFYAERGVKTTNPDVKDMYANALSGVAELASLSARIGQADADNIAALITARERLSAHLASGQAIEDDFVNRLNNVHSSKLPIVRLVRGALTVAGSITEPIEVPLTALSAPGVINAPFPGAKQVGVAALVLSKLPRALLELGRAGSVGVQAERMVVRGRSLAEGADELGEIMTVGERSASSLARSRIAQATDVFGRKRLQPGTSVNEADMLFSESGNKLNGYTKVDASQVVLRRGADAVTYLDEGGHLAGFVFGGSQLAHRAIYGHIFQTSEVRGRALDFIRQMHLDPLERLEVLKRLVNKRRYYFGE